MPHFANQADRLAMVNIEKWIDEIRFEIDNIGGWRTAPERYDWPRLDKANPADQIARMTMVISGWLTTHHPHLETKPLRDLSEYVRSWYADRNPRRLPEQDVIETTLERALGVVTSARDAIAARILYEEDAKPTAPVRRKRRRRTERTEKQLTEKQIEVMHLYGEMKGDFTAVAVRMGIARQSVQSHYKRALKKLGKSAMPKHKAQSLPTDARGQESVANPKR